MSRRRTDRCRRGGAGALALLFIGAAMAATPHPLPYTLEELALALPAPMPATKEAVEAFLHRPLHKNAIQQGGEDPPSMILYDGPIPLITRDGYVIHGVDIREYGRGSKDWRADGKNIFGMRLIFAADACVPAEVIRQALGFPSDLREARMLAGPFMDPSFTRDTSWGGYGMDVKSKQPECAVSLGNLANDPIDP